MPFFSCAASEFVELFVGVGASRVRDLFEKVRTPAQACQWILSHTNSHTDVVQLRRQETYLALKVKRLGTTRARGG